MSDEQEGVIHYRLEFALGPAPRHPALETLNGWRRLLHRLGLIGQDPHRYGGFGFGNLSLALPEGGFIITASQTGGLEHLAPHHYCRVTEADPAHNRVTASGPLPPSSEALTHAAIYRVLPRVGAVFHVHDPRSWSQAERLGLPTTPAQIPYGTPAMAEAVAALLHDSDAEQPVGVFAMAGHQDGLVSYGIDVDHAGCRLMNILARA